MAPNAPPQGAGGNVGEVAGFWDTVFLKTDDDQANDTTTFADAGGLDNISFLTGRYQFEARLYFDGNLTSDMKLRMNFTVDDFTDKVWGTENEQLKQLDPTADLNIDLTSAATGYIVLKGFLITNSDTVGALQFAKLNAGGLDITIFKGSTFAIKKVE